MPNCCFVVAACSGSVLWIIDSSWLPRWKLPSSFLVRGVRLGSLCRRCLYPDDYWQISLDRIWINRARNRRFHCLALSFRAEQTHSPFWVMAFCSCSYLWSERVLVQWSAYWSHFKWLPCFPSEPFFIFPCCYWISPCACFCFYSTILRLKTQRWIETPSMCCRLNFSRKYSFFCS